MSNSKVALLTGGAWWEGSSPANVGHHFVRQAVQNAAKHDRPLRLYICTRKPPPAGELERFVRSHRCEYPLDQSRSPTRPGSKEVILRHLPLDLLDPNSIRKCASRFLAQETHLDVLVLNAAIAPNQREPAGLIVPAFEGEETDPSRKGYLELEKGMMTNVVGTAMLAKLLEPALLNAAKVADVLERPRVVVVSSELHRRLGDLEVSPRTIQRLLSPGSWKGMQTYKLTKLIQTIWLYAIKREYGSRIDCVAISPGFIPSTSLSRGSSYLSRFFMSYVLHFMPFASTVEEGGRKVYQGSLEPITTPEDVQQERTAVYLKDYAPVEADSRVYDENLGKEWKQWIEHATETVTTPIASMVPPAPTVLVVGGTAGIGASLARKLAYQLPPNSEITIAGRNSDAAAEIIASIRQSTREFDGHRDQSTTVTFEKVDCTRMADVKRFCEQYSRHLDDKGRRLDILILTPGILSMSGRTSAAPNSTLDLKMALHYYSRMLIIRELTPFLADKAIVMSVLDGKRSDAHDKAIDWDDLALSQPGHYGLTSAAKHCCAMTDIMMQDFTASPGKGQVGQTPTFIHAYPGFVSTGIFANPGLPFYARFVLSAASKLFGSPPDACADHLINGMVKCHRSTLSDIGLSGNAGFGGKWFNLDREQVLEKLPVGRTVVDRVRAHTWLCVDEQSMDV